MVTKSGNLTQQGYMKPFLAKKDWHQTFYQNVIIDCAVRDRNIIYFGVKEKIPPEKASLMFDHEIPSKIIAVYLDEPDGSNWSCQKLSGMNLPLIGVSRSPFSRPSGLIAARNDDGDVWPMGNGDGPMEHIANGQRPFANRLKCINSYTYAVCSGRRIYKRIQVAKWEPFAELPKVPEHLHMGFNDLDAFSESDMYAVGGCGDIWHFDGKNWKQLGFPSNAQLSTVTCAPDGNVYVSGEGGSLWVGRGDTWKRIYEGSSPVLWNDAFWFDGKLWLASDYQLRLWDGSELKVVEENGKPVSAYGHMDAYDGLLVVAGPEFVYGFDGKTWKLIVAPYLD
ncbi:hypothetical protein [Flavobacterium sp. FlaQc-48]|uniref:hypothetical protein n=1 Tax=Flavobacterium sp. FlaQc-48 TaxID=3374181 RepID=UPI003757B7ED